MFLQIPKAESQVPGLSLSCEIVQDNIAIEEDQDGLVDEYLRIFVDHDGSNPFCDQEECVWGVIFTMSASDATATLLPDEEMPFQFVCLPHGVFITEAIVCELTEHDMPGIWLLFTTSAEPDAVGYSFILREYTKNA